MRARDLNLARVERGAEGDLFPVGNFIVPTSKHEVQRVLPSFFPADSFSREAESRAYSLSIFCVSLQSLIILPPGIPRPQIPLSRLSTGARSYSSLAVLGVPKERSYYH